MQVSKERKIRLHIRVLISLYRNRIMKFEGDSVNIVFEIHDIVSVSCVYESLMTHALLPMLNV